MIGKINGKKVNSEAYIEKNREKIEELKEAFNDYYIKINLLIRFIFQGTEVQNYDCDAIIYGTPKSFIWATKNEVLKHLIEFIPQETRYINISALNIKCYDRNLRNNPRRKECQDKIQVKWYKY